MKVRDIMVILGIAAATVAFTVTLVRPGHVGADGKTTQITATILQPRLKIAGCTFTLKSDKTLYAAGDTPLLLIEATNPTDDVVETSVWVNVSAASPASRFSRALRLPQYLWSRECPLVLKAGDTKTITLDTRTALPAGKSISITMNDKDQTAVIRRLQMLDRSRKLLLAANTAATPQHVSRDEAPSKK